MEYSEAVKKEQGSLRADRIISKIQLCEKSKVQNSVYDVTICVKGKKRIYK